jgi:hypothetical protein
MISSIDEALDNPLSEWGLGLSCHDQVKWFKIFVLARPIKAKSENFCRQDSKNYPIADDKSMNISFYIEEILKKR